MTVEERIALINDVEQRCAEAFSECLALCYFLSVEGGWYHDPKTGGMLDRNPGEMIALIHSEISEMLEGVRKDIMDDHLPERKSEEVEGADALIRIGDYGGYRALDFVGAFFEKLRYNQRRADHKLENRKQQGGKAF